MELVPRNHVMDQLGLFIENEEPPEQDLVIDVHIEENQEHNAIFENSDLECIFLQDMEVAIRKGYFDVEVQNFGTGIQEIRPSFSFVEPLGQMERNWILTMSAIKKETLMPMAAKHNKKYIVEFLIGRGVNVNTAGSEGELAIDYAFLYNDYQTMWLLLEAGSIFPKNFTPGDFSYETNGCAKKIEHLAAEMTEALHRLIEQGNFEHIRTLNFHDSSKIFLSAANRSALATAIEFDQYEIYAYLKSIGAQFRNEHEKKDTLNGLDIGKKRLLEIEMVKYFKPVKDAHIYYLISKSRSKKPVSNLFKRLEKDYKTLDQIPEISLILQVAQYAKYLDIIFDFDEAEISDMCPTIHKDQCAMGLTRYLEGRIYISQATNNILSTLAHELTHLTMHMIYQNNGYPYPSYVSQEILRMMADLIKSLRPSNNTHPAEQIFLITLSSYPPWEYDKELIARMTQILAEVESGKKWLDTNQYSKHLLLYFHTQIKNDCEAFIQNSLFTIEGRQTNFLHNQTAGELYRLQSFEVRCKNIHSIAKLIKNGNKKIFIYKVDSTLLGLIKVVQGTLGGKFLNSKDDYLLLRLECFLFLPDEFTNKIHSEKKATLIFEGNDNLDKDYVLKICEFVSRLPNKIIFVVNKNIGAAFEKKLKRRKMEQQIEEITDDELYLSDLDEKSQTRVLEGKVTFQGRETPLKNLITKEMYKKIKPDFIEDLLKGNKREIGSKLYGISSMEGAYGHVLLDINFDSLKNALNVPSTFFIIESRCNNNKYNREELIQYFKTHMDEDKIYMYNNKKFTNLKYKIILVKFFSDPEFEAFCRENEEQTIYWIKINDLGMDSFRLQKFYNPDFYVQRRINKVTEVMLDETKMEDVFSRNSFDEFIIATEEKVADTTKQKHKKVTYSKIANARQNFNELTKKSNPVHWLEKVGDKLVWKASSKSMRKLRPCILKDGTQTTSVEESDLAADIVNEKVLIIADYPGMGKTTTLTRLYTEEAIAAGHWIIRINLRKKFNWKNICSHDEGREIHKITFDVVIRFLREVHQDCKLEDSENEMFLKSLLYKTEQVTKSLLLAFDGFDEADNQDRDTIIKLLKFLKYETRCKIWITTRLHHKELLENELCTFAVELEPFDDGAKMAFIKKYFCSRLTLILDVETYTEIFSGKEIAENTKIAVYAEKLLKKMKDIFLEDISKFIGTPLQLNLVLSGSASHFKTWVQNTERLATEDKKKLVPNFSHLGQNLLEVYKNFIERKYNIYFLKANSNEDIENTVRSEVEKYHYELAQSLIFKANQESESKNGKLSASTNGVKLISRDETEVPQQKSTNLALSVGIVQSKDEKNFEFVHFTFREYYCAQVFLQYLSKKLTGKNDLRDSPKSDQLLEKLLKILEREEHELIRRFINIGLDKLPRSAINQDVCKGFAPELERKPNVLHTIAKEGCQNIFCILYFICKWSMSPKTLLRIKDSNGNPLVYSIIKGKNRLMLYILFQEIRKLSRNEQNRVLFNKNQNWHGSILHLGQMFSNYELFKLIWKQTNDILRPDKRKTLLFITDCIRETILHQACSKGNKEIANYVLHQAKQQLKLSRGEMKNLLLLKDAKGRKTYDLLPMALNPHDMESIQADLALNGNIQ